MPNNHHEKIQCWKSLLGLQNLSTYSRFIIVGDFNTTLHPKEKRGGSLVRDPSREHMEDSISSLDLSDIKPKINKYTWTNRREGKGHIVARLDIFLVSNCYLEDNRSCSSNILTWEVFDHRPVSLSLSEQEDLGPIPFHFNPI